MSRAQQRAARGHHPVYLRAPVKAFSGGKEDLESAALSGALALLDAAGDAPPELILLGSAHPREFGGLDGPQLAERLAHALAGRGISIAVEFYMKPGVYVAEASLSASANGADLLHEAALRIAGAQRRTIGVLAIEQMRLKERDERTTILRSLIHHEERRYGLTMPALGALLESYATARIEGLTDALRRLIFLNRGNATANPRAHIRKVFHEKDYESDRNPAVSDPLRLWGIAPTSSGYAGVLLDRDRPAGRAVRIIGIGQGTDRVAVSARDHFLTCRATTEAMQNLPECCGLEPPAIRRGIRYAEIHDAFPIIEYQGLIDTGLLDPDHAVREILRGAIAPSGRVPVNLSGGVMGGHPVGATGVGQIVELVLQGMGVAETQCDWPLPHASLALNVGGPATFNCVTLLHVSESVGDEPATRLALPRRVERGDFDLSLPACNAGERRGDVVAATRLHFPPPGHPTPTEIVFVDLGDMRLFAIPTEADIAVGETVDVFRADGVYHARPAIDARVGVL